MNEIEFVQHCVALFALKDTPPAEVIKRARERWQILAQHGYGATRPPAPAPVPVVEPPNATHWDGLPKRLSRCHPLGTKARLIRSTNSSLHLSPAPCC